MNITIVQGAFLPIPLLAGGAVEKLWFDLGREFALRRLALTHISRVWPSLPSRSELDSVVHQRVSGFNYPRSRVLAKLMDLFYSLCCFFTGRRSDIIVTNTFFLPLLLSLFAQCGIVYVSVHRYRQGQMKLYRKVDRLQCVSTSIADAVREQAPAVGALERVVPNYVSTRLTEQEIAQDWEARKREVLFVGRVHPEKGIALLIQAFAVIDPMLRAVCTLRIIGPHETAADGDAAFLTSLKQTASALNLEVDWVGPIYDRDELIQAYRWACIFVYLSAAAKGEALPLAPLRSHVRRLCPVVTSDVAFFGDFIRPGSNAESFALAADNVPGALGAVIQTLMGGDSRQRTYSPAGLQTAQGFTLSRVADAFVDDFVSLRKP